MRIYNTKSRKKEEFVPIDQNEVKIYSCGPTVYNFFHIGNARPLIIFDVLRRYLQYRGYNVKFVQNFTDVDDKMIKRANEEGITVEALADRFIKEYFVDAKGLGIVPADVHPKATENIDAIIETIKTLIDKGYAYVSTGDVYFKTRAFESYGLLSKQRLEDLEAGARIDISESKEDPLDFALWKAAKEGEPHWPSPWGNGRPGWHIECTAMANRYLGKTIDIHCGGSDLVFPHHENEIAQSEAANGCEFARYWMHNGYINVDNKKMSKSAGNFFTVRDVASQFDYEVIRFFMLSVHYRNPVNYSYDLLTQSKAGLERLYTTRENLDFLLKNAPQGEEDQDIIKSLEGCRTKFIDSMDDDLNTADAVASIFELSKEINSKVDSTSSVQTVKAAIELFDELCCVLGIVSNKKEEEAGREVEALIEKRQQARAKKDFAEADRIRDKLKSMGIILEDTPSGVKWKKI